MERFHKPAYLEVLESAPRGTTKLEYLGMGLGTQDCPIFPDIRVGV